VGRVATISAISLEKVMFWAQRSAKEKVIKSPAVREIMLYDPVLMIST
jgi:hypothetical protein